MREDEDEGSDILPDVGEMFKHPLASSSSTPASLPFFSNGLESKEFANEKGKRKRSDSATSSSRRLKEQAVWVPPEADVTLDIPGEIVLARDSQSGKQYWYAKIVDYIPPESEKQVPKYKVLWMDTTEGEIPRSWFWTLQEDGFVTCRVCRFQMPILQMSHFFLSSVK